MPSMVVHPQKPIALMELGLQRAAFRHAWMRTWRRRGRGLVLFDVG